jgi:hypothetical protein
MPLTWSLARACLQVDGIASHRLVGDRALGPGTATTVGVAEPAHPPGGAGLPHQGNQHPADQAVEELLLARRKDLQRGIEDMGPSCSQVSSCRSAGIGERHHGRPAIRTRLPTDQLIPFEPVDQPNCPRVAEPHHPGQQLNGRVIEEVVKSGEAGGGGLRAPRSFRHRLFGAVSQGEGQCPQPVGGPTDGFSGIGASLGHRRKRLGEFVVELEGAGTAMRGGSRTPDIDADKVSGP